MINKIKKLYSLYWFKFVIHTIFSTLWYKYRYYYYKYSYDWGKYWKNIIWWKNVILKWNTKNIFLSNDVIISDYSELSSGWSKWCIYINKGVWISRNCIIWWEEDITIDKNTII